MKDSKIYYISEGFNRNHLLRKNQEFLIQSKERTKELLIVYWQGRFLVEKSDNKVVICNFAQVEVYESLVVSNEKIILGEIEEHLVWVIDLSDKTSSEILEHSKEASLEDLRKIIVGLNNNEASILAYAKGMINWQNKHQFCGLCGTRNKCLEEGHVMACGNKQCQNVTYPRTDPAVIVLVEFKKKGEPTKCLLGRRKIPNGWICSTLAGFVEPGESLEQTVEREIKEETNLVVNNIRYVASQPWPFPSSIMIGFRAESNSLNYTLDKTEVPDACWYTAEDLKIGMEQGILQPSLKDSIARFLITTWMRENLDL